MSLPGEILFAPVRELKTARGAGDFQIDHSCIRYLARDAREACGLGYGPHAWAGWQKAKAHGWRIRKIVVLAMPEYLGLVRK